MAARDYVTVPIHYSSKRRNKTNGLDSDSTVDSASNTTGSDDAKDDKHWLLSRVQHKTPVVVVTLLFFIALLIYLCLPNDQSLILPAHSLSDQHILSPAFQTVDTHISDDIPRIDPLQNAEQLSNNIEGSFNVSIVYFLSHEDRNLCQLLLSLSSVISSTTSLTPQAYDIIVFMPTAFHFNKIDLHKIAERMNFKILKYESSPVSKLEYIVNTLSQHTHYDSIIYLDPNTFVLRDLSVLHSAVAMHDEYHFGGLWSFDMDKPCLSLLMLVIDLKDIASSRKVNYKELFTQQSLCNSGSDRIIPMQIIMQSNAVDVNEKHLSAIRAMGNKFGIVAFPWWYAMQYQQFKAQSEQLPLIIDVSEIQKENLTDDEWLSIRRKAIDSCVSVTA